MSRELFWRAAAFTVRGKSWFSMLFLRLRWKGGQPAPLQKSFSLWAAYSVFSLLSPEETFTSDPQAGIQLELAGWRLSLPCSFQLRSCSWIFWFFPASAQPEGAALSLGNCTAWTTSPFLQCQLPWSPCSPSAAEVQGKAVNETGAGTSAFPAPGPWQPWVSHPLLPAGIQRAILQDTPSAFWAAGFCVLRLFSGSLSCSHGIPSAFQPVKPCKFPSAEGLVETYDLFQAGNGWKCELRNPPEPSCESCRAMSGVDKKWISKINSQMHKWASKLTDWLWDRCLLGLYGNKTICFCGWRWVQKSSFWYPNIKIWF